MKKSYISPKSCTITFAYESSLLTSSITGIGVKQSDGDARGGSEAASNHSIWNNNDWMKDGE